MIDTTFRSDNTSRFRKTLLQVIQRLIMTVFDKIRDENVEYHTNIEARKTLALSSGKMD